MAILGKPQGVFDLNDSDMSVGSFLLKRDVCEILEVSESDIQNLKFQNIDGVEVIDERKVQKAWYGGEIKNAPPVENSSLDEFILISVIKKTLPNCEVERQLRIKRFKMDLKLTYEKKSVFVEFDGPSHFSVSRYGPPKHEPFRKKKIIEDETGVEVVNWAYWVQRCAANVKVLFDASTKGYGALWSTNIHFGDFYFENSAEIICEINQRFNLEHGEGCGYFYGPNSRARNNPEHPIVDRILEGKEKPSKLLPKGYKNKREWLPKRLWKIT